jgi:hypothetical protein
VTVPALRSCSTVRARHRTGLVGRFFPCVSCRIAGSNHGCRPIPNTQAGGRVERVHEDGAKTDSGDYHCGQGNQHTSLRASDRIRSTDAKSALGAGLDGRDQPGHSTLNPRSWELAYILTSATPAHRCCPFSFSSLRLEHRELALHECVAVTRECQVGAHGLEAYRTRPLCRAGAHALTAAVFGIVLGAMA